MSAFTDTTLIKKLADLNSSQQSIQTLSLWLIHHRKHYVTIVKTWAKLIYSVSENRKLILMYLANDVIQNSKKKGPEYGKEFSSTLPQVFKHIGETCFADKLVRNLRRILDIWEERGVYDASKLEECRQAFETAHSNATANKRKTVSGNGNDTELGKIATINNTSANNSKNSSKDLKSSLIASLAAIAATKRASDSSKQKSKRKRSNSSGTNFSNIVKPYGKEKIVQSTSNSNTDNDGSSPYVPMGEAPEPEELIRVLEGMEQTASSDADVRELIAKLPQEISDVNHIHKLSTRQSAVEFLAQVNEAIQIITQYNRRLAAEMEERGKMAIMLRDFQNEQNELLSQAENRLDEYKKKLQKVLTVQREIRDHLSNLPDLTNFSDDSGVLAPLPSPSDLFNIH